MKHSYIQVRNVFQHNKVGNVDLYNKVINYAHTHGHTHISWI